MGCSGTRTLKYCIKGDKFADDLIIPQAIDQITLIYKSKDYKKGDKIKLFGEIFAKNNKDKCKIIFNEKKMNL